MSGGTEIRQDDLARAELDRCGCKSLESTHLHG